MNITFTLEVKIPALDQINAALAQVASIQKQRLALQIKQMTIDDSVVEQLVEALNAAILRDTGDEAAAAAAQTANAATIADLQNKLAPNPTLLASVTAALANAAAATPPANPVTPTDPVLPTLPTSPADPTTPVTQPAPDLYDASKAYVAGDTVSDAAGNIWTDVEAPIGDAPGTTEGNWKLTSPVPTPGNPPAVTTTDAPATTTAPAQ